MRAAFYTPRAHGIREIHADIGRMFFKNVRHGKLRESANPSSTGYSLNGDFSFAQELANALGTTVWAPDDLIYVSALGKISIGKENVGSMIPFYPNERGRIK